MGLAEWNEDLQFKLTSVKRSGVDQGRQQKPLGWPVVTGVPDGLLELGETDQRARRDGVWSESWLGWCVSFAAT
jgi:hypothetical protein